MTRVVTTLDVLYQAVLAAPDDDERRLVLGDAWQERGDPRGELISLQAKRLAKQVKTPSKREKELIDEHGEAWLGPLAPYLRNPKFHLGFVSEAAVRGGKPDVTPVATLRDWSTIERLTVRNTPAHHVLTLEALTSLRAVEHLFIGALQQVLKTRPTLRWEELQLLVPALARGGREDMATLGALAPQLPNLKTLRVTQFPAAPIDLGDLMPLADSELLARLTVFQAPVRIRKVTHAARRLLDRLVALGATPVTD